MRRAARFLFRAGALVAGAIIVLVLALAFPPTRAAVISFALRAAVRSTGFHYAGGNVTFAHRTLTIGQLRIDDDRGDEFLTARRLVVGIDLAGLIGRSDRRLGLRSVELDDPVLFLRRRSDGSWNFMKLVPQKKAQPAPPAAAPALGWRMRVAVSGGTIDLLDPEARVAAGKAVRVTNLVAAATIDQGARSGGRLAGELRSGLGSAALRGAFFEDDRDSFGRAALCADNVPVAPVVDAFVPSSAFVALAGRARIRLRAYALGYGAAAPQWQVSGDGAVRDASLHVTPLALPVRDVNTALVFHDGLLSFARATGVAAGMPLQVSGAVQLFGGVTLMLGATGHGRLEQAKRLFSFAQREDIAGPYEAAVRIFGPPSDVHVAGIVTSSGARYAAARLPDVRASFYYARQHVTVSALDLVSGEAKVWSQADFDTSSPDVTTTMTAAVTAPALDIPIVGNVAPGGVVQAIGSATGPVSSLDVEGYAQATGSKLATIRTYFAGDPQHVALGPLLFQARGGEAVAWARRSFAPASQWSGALIARHVSLAVHGGQLRLADVAVHPIALPSLNTVLDGSAFVFADQSGAGRQTIAVNARAAPLDYHGVHFDAVQLVAAGGSRAVRIGRARIQSRALDVLAHGTVALDPGLKPAAAALAGSASADLAGLAPLWPATRLAGSVAGRFALAYDGTRLLASAQATSPNASIAGVPVRATSALVAASRETTTLLASVALPRGGVWAVGSVPNKRAAPGAPAQLVALVPRLDLAALAPVGLHAGNGNATGFVTVSGSAAAPRISAAAAVSGSYATLPYTGDLDLSYAGGTLRSHASRLSYERNQATFDGDVTNVFPERPLAGARLALRVRILEGNLAALNRFTKRAAPLDGSYDAEAGIYGNVAQPTIDARIQSTVGTIRGVTFDDLVGNLQARSGTLLLSRGAMQIGASRFGLRGEATPSRVDVTATGPHVDMSDFNDFFGGADVFGGIGSFDLSVLSSARGLSARGTASLDDAALRDYALGHIQTAFSSSRHGGLRAVVDQSGPGGSMELAGTVGFRSYRRGFPDFATAVYRVRAHVRNLQVDEALPLIHQENLGLSGRLNADGNVHGTLHAPQGNMTFALFDGYLRGISIEQFAGSLAADAGGVRLSDATLKLPFLSAQGSGTLRFAGKRIDAAATMDAPHLSAMARALRLPGSLRGSATGRIELRGSLDAPHATADVDATRASFYNVAFDEAKLHAQYAPGELSIGNTSLSFANGGGRVSVTGVLPVQLRPLALGPKDKPVDVAMTVQGMHLAVLNPLTSKYATLGGNLNAQATITGSAGNPVGKGTARIENASIVSPLQTVPLTGASGDLTFESDTITLRHFHAAVGSGALDAAGAAHIVPAEGLRTYAGLQLWSRLVFHNTQVNVPNWISGNLNGQLSMTRSGPTPYVAGTVGVSNSTIPFAAIYALAEGGAIKAPPGPAPGVPALRPGHTIVYGGGLWGPQTHVLTTIGQPTPQPTGFALPSVDMNVGLNAGNNVRIRGGSSIDLTTTGGITIAGNLQSPALAGQFQTVRGQVGYFDTTFRVVSGTVTFDPTSGLLPTLDATAVTNVSGAQITLTVSGRVDNLNTDLESNPSMSRDEIIATLLHAPQVTALTSFNSTQTQAMLVQTAQNFFNAELARNLLYPVESALAQELNIESISLIFNQYGALAVEVRTRFTPSVAAVYQSSVSAPITTAYGMSYRLRDYLALDVLQTSRPDYAQYSTVFNLRYTFR